MLKFFVLECNNGYTGGGRTCRGTSQEHIIIQLMSFTYEQKNWKPSLLSGLFNCFLRLRKCFNCFFLRLRKCTSVIFVDKKKISSIMINPYCFPDVDECSLNTHDCDAHAICTNTEGSFTCKCDLNSHHVGDGKTCTPHRKPSFFHVFVYKQLFTWKVFLFFICVFIRWHGSCIHFCH